MLARASSMAFAVSAVIAPVRSRDWVFDTPADESRSQETIYLGQVCEEEWQAGLGVFECLIRQGQLT